MKKELMFVLLGILLFGSPITYADHLSKPSIRLEAKESSNLMVSCALSNAKDMVTYRARNAAYERVYGIKRNQEPTVKQEAEIRGVLCAIEAFSHFVRF